MTDDKVFWADVTALEISRAKSEFQGATGITPSGEIHIGNLREIVTADSVTRALRDLGKKPKLIYIADNFDPLRRVYPFLDPQKYQEHVGKPLSEIPAPEDTHPSYSEYFLAPFLRSLKLLDVDVEVVRADQLYKEGKYTQNIIRALEGKDRIREILKDETGKDTDESWSPFVPICPETGKMSGNKVLSYDAKREEVEMMNEAGKVHVVSMNGGGKLVWRVDWPARWQILNVTYEPFGKDHASRGGSYDTGVRISREVFGYEPPFPIVYEWISLRGLGDMSSSKGNVIPIHKMLEVIPADVLKYGIIKVKPNRRIVFDPGLPTLQLVDEFDDVESKNRNARAAELSAISHSPSLGVPFRHLVVSVQVASGNVDKVISVLERSGYRDLNRNLVEQRVSYAKQWLETYAPEDIRFVVQEAMPETSKTLSPAQKAALGAVAEQFKEGMNAEEVHSLLYTVKEEMGLAPQQLFEAVYRSILGKEKGPRAGFFLASLDAEFVKHRFQEVAKSTS